MTHFVIICNLVFTGFKLEMAINSYGFRWGASKRMTATVKLAHSFEAVNDGPPTRAKTSTNVTCPIQQVLAR